MGLTRVLNDTLATNAGVPAETVGISMGSTGSRTLGPQGSASITPPSPTAEWFDTLGKIAEIGRGTTDTARTYIALYNHSGTLIYIFPNDAGNALTVQSTKP